MRKKRVMVIGPTNCGKTAIVNALNGFTGKLRKTQDIIYGENTMDVPGSYIENTWMYKHIISAAQDASHVLILVDQSKTVDYYSPGFAKTFRCPVIGVITKCDLTPENEENCVKQLKKMGVAEPYFRVSMPNNQGIQELKDHLFENKESKGGEK